ncbi:MAG: sodium:dicarboxylate symporter, partial [Pelosinus sp.]|nr:sodium:dicarboxylate symporter [Pelosinus sp.]
MAKEKKGIGLSAQIFIALILGVVFGYIFPTYGEALKPIGDAFIRMIKMIVVPLIFSSLIMGIAGTGDFKKLGRLGAKAILWFEVATTLALFVGLLVANVFQPGAGVAMSVGADVGAAATAAKKTIDMTQMMVNIVPTNVVDAMGRGDMLQIIFFSCFFGVAAAAMGEKGKPVVTLAISVAEIMFQFTNYVMKLAP